VSTVAITSACWLVTAFLGPETDRETLIAFYRRVRPFGPGWTRIRQAAGVTEDEAGRRDDNVPLALLGWVSGCMVIWSSLFVVGNALYGRTAAAALLLAVFVASGLVLLWVGRQLWSGRPESAPAE
jgi:hypothetical protein